ncbi:MAG: flagellar hook-length control protein FliK [Gemmatimonadota bacterium]
MTGLIGSLVGAASTAVERLTGTFNTQAGASSQGATPAGEFAALLAAMSSPAAMRAQGTGDSREVLDELTELIDVAEAEGEIEEGTSLRLAAALAGLLQAQGESGVPQPAGELTEAAVAAIAAGAGRQSEGAELEAEAEAAAVDEVAASSAANEVNNDLEMLQPEFRTRLDRVIERMEAEFGHSVRVVEAHRSQARQDFLYEQGRSRSGDVVTWTRNSNHTQGRAVDVMIDGTYNNPVGYQRLAQIAAEEGLRTLGPMDPGHIELPKSAEGASRIGRLAAEPVTAPPAQAGGLARVADVARVAEVAQIADVARVAQVARVADPARPGAPVQAPTPAQAPTLAQAPPTVQPHSPASVQEPAVAASPAAMFAARAGQAGLDGQGFGGSESRRQGQGEAKAAASPEMEMLRGDSGFGRTFMGGPVAEAQLTSGSDAVQRAAQILAMKEGAEAAPVNHLLLRLDSPSGGQDRIRVDLRGSTVGTTLNIENSAEADRLASRIGELRQSLERQGLEPDALRVRTAQVSGLERAEVTRAALSAAEAEAGRGGNSRSGSDPSNPRDGWKEAEEQQRRDSAESRNRSRKEQQKEGNS